MARKVTVDGEATFPSEVSSDVSWFDRFATWATLLVSRAAFFTFAVLLVVVWAPSYFLFRDVGIWELWINTATTIGTWLLVALLQNSQQRAGQAEQHKQNAVAAGLAVLLDAAAAERADQLDHATEVRLYRARDELLCAVGLEERESA
jgi:low affinity Fe/Cu permease